MRFNYCVTYGNHHSAMIGNAETLADVVTKAAAMRAYYDGTDPNSECRYENVAVSFSQACEACDGAGRIARRFKRAPPRIKDCAACGAHGNFPLPMVG